MSAKKKAVNLSIDAALIAEAKEAGTNMSAVLERALKEDLRERRTKQLQEENREAIAAHNRLIEQHGLLSDDWRKF
ncbi:MAG: type II toxin-antitoxin system CcdA family antitoxin [Hyphomicrobium sp.]|jgi:antitoxin CcdA